MLHITLQHLEWGQLATVGSAVHHLHYVNSAILQVVLMMLGCLFPILMGSVYLENFQVARKSVYRERH